MKEHRMVIEGGAAVGIAAIQKIDPILLGAICVIVTSGQNVDLSVIREIIGTKHENLEPCPPSVI